MRCLLAACVAVVVLAPAAAAKEISSLVLVGPKGTLVAPVRTFELRLVAAPHAPYVLVYPLMEDGVPARPGRWFPRSHVYCEGWRSGVEAGCTVTRALPGPSFTGTFTGEPVRMVSLRRGATSLRPYGNEATAILLALHQRGRRAVAPAACVWFTARWNAPGWPARFCVAAAGGVYANGLVHPLPARAAAFVTG